ncbi:MULTISPECIES: hypothetical protein [unclassified Pseudofrankia]|uniref:hypothetical protein n=1 Tax=unclassified Pseudofrankia TaxID=2994372 RepID=UPI0008D9D6FF|nr:MULTISPECIES: hypothetical protein [unclassified Pseudofrankia]MDT3440897.1 hypothetical protein [Pseudofrankia sp. BMG5.37]OHV65768.1 hypothetical protein BCD48_36255 [Pseudofrankia sp. BMG5.36]
MTGRHEAGRPGPGREAGHPAPSADRPVSADRPSATGANGAGPSDIGPSDIGPARDGEAGREQTGFGFRILPAGWMRGLLFTVTAVLTVVIALSDLTSAWVLLALPLVVVIAVAYLETLDRITRP